jgi:SAM-dependent methyltransferase
MPSGTLDWLVRDPRGRLKRLRLRLTVVPPRTALQKRRALPRGELSAADRALLRATNSYVHPYEDMYVGDGFPYFFAGVAAVRAIDATLQAARAGTPRTILDMPCGFGRVIRSLTARFPNASIYACDIRPAAVRFCSRRFGAQGVIATAEPEELTFPTSFDLIWCSSLITHFDAPRALALVDLFARNASPGGIIVFTANGTNTVDEIRAGADYKLTPAAIIAVLAQYERDGYGYHNYPSQPAYGVSLTSPEWVSANVEGRHGLQNIAFAPGGWGGGQDVYAYRNP